MRRFGYFLYSKKKSDFDKFWDQLKNEDCDSIMFEEYTSINGKYPVISELLENSSKGDLIILPSLDHLFLSLKQLSIRIDYLKKKGLHLIVLEEKTINTIINDSDFVYDMVMKFCEYSSVFHSNCVLSRDLSFKERRFYHGWKPEEIEVSTKVYNMYLEGGRISNIAKKFKKEVEKIKKYIELHETGEIENIRSWSENKYQKKTHGRPKGLTEKSKEAGLKARKLKSDGFRVTTILEELKLSKTHYYRLMSLDNDEFYK